MIPQNYFTEVEVAINHGVSIWVPPTPTSLSMGFYFHCQDVALTAWATFSKLAKKEQGPQHLLKIENQHGVPCLSSRTCKSRPKMNGQNFGQ